MNKSVSIALLVVGIVLIVFGIGAWESVGSEMSEAVTGAPSNKAIWLLGGGVLLAVAGLVGTLRKKS
jgi:hypothetical protein